MSGAVSSLNKHLLASLSPGSESNPGNGNNLGDEFSTSLSSETLRVLVEEDPRWYQKYQCTPNCLPPSAIKIIDHFLPGEFASAAFYNLSLIDPDWYNKESFFPFSILKEIDCFLPQRQDSFSSL